MSRFLFHTFGASQGILLEVQQADLRELSDSMNGRRFIQGRLIEIDGCDAECGILIAINRIQMISEVEP